jgi:predicted transcriptional regulator
MTIPQETKPEATRQENDILSTIQRYPEGVSITTIGNELGVDWRSLTEAIQSLLRKQQIEGIGRMYYLQEQAREDSQ